jgi:hypothetical protein
MTDYHQGPADHSADASDIADRPDAAEGLAVPSARNSRPVPAQSSPGPGVTSQRPEYVYALGQVRPRFASLAIEKEFAQVAARSAKKGQTDRQVLATVLGDRANRYLARQISWAFVVEGLDTYILSPRDPADYELLVEAVRPDPDISDIDVLVGIVGPSAPPEVCGGLGIPIVLLDQLYSFDRDSLINAIPRPDGVPAKEEEKFRSSARELFDRIIQLAGNRGTTDEHRALNYLAVRYPAVYARSAEEHAENNSLAAVSVRPSRLSQARSIVDVIFSFTHRQTDVTSKYFCRVDVTEEFPFLVSKLSPFLAH